MTRRSVFLNFLGLAFMAFCLYFIFGHLRYLSDSGRPNREVISRELDEVMEAFPGERVSPVETFEKKTFYVSAGVQMRVANSVLVAAQSHKSMEARGWRKVRVAHGDVERYCKGDLVAEITPLELSGLYALQVNWGNADAVCQPE